MKLLKLWEVSEHLDFCISAVIPGFMKFRQKTSPKHFLKKKVSVFFLSILVPFQTFCLLKEVSFFVFFCWGYHVTVTSIFVGAMNVFASKAFQRYDATNDGFLDIDELAHTLKVPAGCVFCLFCWVE